MIGVLTLTVFAALVLMGLTRPSWAIALLVLFFALEVSLQASVAPFRAFPPLANFFLAGVLGCSLGISLLGQTKPFTGTITPVLGIILLIYIWSIVSLTWTPAIPDAHNHGSNIMREEWPYVILVILIAPMLVDGLADWDNSRQIILFFGSIIVMTVLVNPEFTIKLGRIGVMLDGINRTSPLAIGQMGGALAIIGGLYRGRIAGRVSTLLGLGGFLMGLLLALYSGSRGQAIFALVCMLALFPVSRQLKSVGAFLGNSLALLLAVVLAYIAFSLVTGGADIDRWRSDRLEDAGGIRLQNIGVLLSAFVNNPSAWFIGLGFNTFSTLGSDLGQGYSHCTFVDVLCEEGIPCFVGLLVMCGMVVRAGKRLFLRFENSPSQRSALATLLALTLYQFLLCNKEGNLWAAVNFFMLCCIVVRIDRREALDLPRNRVEDAVDAQDAQADDGSAEVSEAHRPAY
jgi:hypothetical protein